MRSVYLATVAIVIIFVTVFSVINMSGEALFTRASTESLVSLPSHFRWGYGGYVTVAQYYGTRNQVGNLSGIARPSFAPKISLRYPAQDCASWTSSQCLTPRLPTMG